MRGLLDVLRRLLRGLPNVLSRLLRSLRGISGRLLHGSAGVLRPCGCGVAGVPSSLLSYGAGVLGLGGGRVGQFLRLDGRVRSCLLRGSRRLGALLLRKAERLADVGLSSGSGIAEYVAGGLLRLLGELSGRLCRLSLAGVAASSRSSQCRRGDLGGLGLCGAHVALDGVCGALGDLGVGRVGCILDGVGGILQAQCWEACADGGDTVAELGRGCGRGDLESGSGGGEDGAGDAREDVGECSVPSGAALGSIGL